jgi:aconitate hydratase
MIPFLADKNDFEVGDYVYIENVRKKLLDGDLEFSAKVIGNKTRNITLRIDPLTSAEKDIILKGCLINYYRG